MGQFFSSSLGIAALVVVILVIVYFMSPKSRNTNSEEESNHAEQVAVSAVPSANKARVENNDAELVAAIMGALSVHLDTPASKLIIKSIKRVDGNSSVWREHGLERY